MNLGIVTNLCIGGMVVMFVVFACVIAATNPSRMKPFSTDGWDNGLATVKPTAKARR